ncbi:MAG: cytochrome ubiquinol oxidase subunit I, partial [Verrucomicrobia bacterium]|nr:cytochrome ubiquinol oxidase subunit I [Verrucomicrobiota bacterium]
MDAEILHRAQFGINLTFHYIYPPLSIGLSVALIIFEWFWLKTKDPVWEGITKFWIRVFALTFALGVATGVPLVFGFGTNWSRWSSYVGDVLGSALAAEGLFAFTMEAGALGILLFGWNKVSKKVHFAATVGVALGAHFSGVWITNVNSWMQTPAGYEIRMNAKGQTYAAVTDWWAMAFNPSALSHLSHVILGCWMAGSFLVISVSAYYLLKKRYQEFSMRSMKVGLAIGFVSCMLQLVSADHLATLIAKYNPVKFAAFEGVFKTEEYTPLYAIGYVDTEKKEVIGIGVPGALSWLVHGDAKTPVDGLDQAPVELQPSIQAVFQVYHIMVATWAFMFAGVLIGVWLWKKDRWTEHPRLLKYLIISVIFPQVGNMCGWYSTCLGRQPWSVYKLLKTKEAYSPSVTANEALFTLCIYIFIYL